MICHTNNCNASQANDNNGRPYAVAWHPITQPTLNATGHHILNRVADGSIHTHISAWTTAERARATANLQLEHARITQLLNMLNTALEATR